MKRMSLIVALVGFAVLSVLTADTSAYYHPGLGRWMSRDPGTGGAMRLGGTGPAVGGGFVPRDPGEELMPPRIGQAGLNGQYADGMNLYEYAHSRCTVLVDPSGEAAKDCNVVVKRIATKVLQWFPSPKIALGHTWIAYPGRPGHSGSVGFAPRPGENPLWGTGVVYLPDPDEDEKPDDEWPAVESSDMFRVMEAGPMENVVCYCVTCNDIYDCIEAVASDWKETGATYSLPLQNCAHFVASVLRQCCLNDSRRTLWLEESIGPM